MKFRLGFVTNLSSSNYICDTCHNYEEGMDLYYAS